jgi:hypothetical protein
MKRNITLEFVASMARGGGGEQDKAKKKKEALLAYCIPMKKKKQHYGQTTDNIQHPQRKFREELLTETNSTKSKNSDRFAFWFYAFSKSKILQPKNAWLERQSFSFY